MPFLREKLSPPILRLEISGSDTFVTPPTSPGREPSPTFRERARALSNAAIPSSRRTSQDDALREGNIGNTTSLLPPRSPLPVLSPGISKARDESQKLLAHVLEQLRHRPKCPPSYTSQSYAAPVAKSIIARPSALRTTSEFQTLNSENEDTSERAFSPDLAFDLMNRLRDVLIISLSHGWQIFGERWERLSQRGGELDGTVPSSPFRRRRRIASFDARRLSSSKIESTELLSQCISVLQSIVSEDCRFPLTPPRPTRPPNSLQAISLDIALLLVHMHAESHAVISQVGFALLPAFVSFKAEMHPRLLLFFEGILRGMLHEERRLRGLANGEHFAVIQADGSPPTVSIQVEPYEDAHTDLGDDTQSWTSRSPYSGRSVPSQSASGRSLSSYRLLSLVSPLLAVISDAIVFSKASTFTVHRLGHMFDMIVDLRPDASLNVLETIAYHTPKARSTALSILYSYWPHALGHCFITRPFESLANTDASLPHHPHAHQFVLWRFTEPTVPSLFDGSILRECRSCLKQIVGVGLFCPLCICAVHFDCYDYPDGNLLTQYPIELDSSTQKVAVHRFCHVQPPTSGHKSTVQHILGHTFRVVNMFTLSICFICKLPLWGCHSQGFKCDNCNHFVHVQCTAEPAVPQCLTAPLTSAHTIISPHSLRNSFDNHFKGLLELNPDSIRHHEDNLICSDILWVQLQILNNGLALGSIFIEGGEEASKSFSMELQFLLDRFRGALLSQIPVLSDMLSGFDEECHSPLRETLLFDWPTLVFLTTSIKFADEAPQRYAGDLRDPFLDTQPDNIMSQPHYYDAIPLGLIRDNLATNFQIYLDIAAETLLGQLYHVGLIELPEIRLVETKHLLQYKESLCLFALPLSLDLSANVETLMTAIEACLSDIDLSVNEAGFLLLVRRVWPTKMSTDYALRRLMKSVLVWILAEDERLAVILRDYVPLERSLPGVRTSSMRQPWPSSTKKPPFASSSNNGGDYVAHRRSLLRSYAAAWLLALHDLDARFYGETCFELVLEIAGEPPAAEASEVATSSLSSALKLSKVDLSLRHITRLCQAFVVFTTFEDLFVPWLKSTLTRPLNKPIPSLQRLLNRDSNLNQSSSSPIDVSASLPDGFDTTAIDPWGVLLRIASRDEEGLRQCLQWLNIFALSAVDIPESVFQRFKTLTDRLKFSAAETYPLIHATFLCVWIRSLGRQELLGMISSVHLRLSADVSRHSNEGNVRSTITDFIRLSLATCLLLSGCPRGDLIGHGMIMESEVLQLPSRSAPDRRTVTRASTVPDPIHVDTSFIFALGEYVNARQEGINVIVARFFYLFAKECSLLETHEVDNFILRNARVLSSCVWSFYGMQSSHLSSICPSLLMRILVVDPQPLEALLQTSLSFATRWEERLNTLKQLFRIILDVINPSFVVEDRQWQPSATIIFYNYFTAMWKDPQEEVKVAVDTWSRTLLPAHFEAITNCWNEALLRAPMSERVKLVNFLIRLHSLFPGWRVLSWDAIIEILSEEDYIPTTRDPDIASLHVSPSQRSDLPPINLNVPQIPVVLLSLKMISSGIDVNILTLLQLKKHLVHILGFSNISTFSAPGSQVFYVAFEHTRSTDRDVSSCMDELLSVLDASRPFTVDASAMTESLPSNDAPSSLLVGSIFVDVFLALITGSEDLLDLPFLTIKRLIECLLVVMYKHDMGSRPLRHLQGGLRKAVRRILNLVPTGISYELRQLSLIVAQTYIKLWPNTSGSFVLESIEVCSQVLSDVEPNKDDLLASQATSFIEGALSMFAESGITIALLKRTHSESFFDVLRSCTENSSRDSPESQGLRDILLRDTVSKIVEIDAESFQLVIHNLSLFIDKVHNGAYDPGLVRYIGSCLTTAVRRTAEWPSENFDPSPLLLIISILMKNNPTEARDFLGFVDVILRVVLTRFIISQSSLVRILDVAKHLHVRIKKQSATASLRLEQNRIISVVLEIYGEGLRRKSRIVPSTLAAMAEVFLLISGTDATEYDNDLDSTIAKLGVDGIAYLQTRSPQGINAEAEVNISLSIANIILCSWKIDSEPIQQLISDQPSEKFARQLGVNVWNVLLLAALFHKSPGPGALLMKHFPAFVTAYRESLAASSSVTHGIVDAAANINHCYGSVKLWLLLEGMLSRIPELLDGRASIPKAMPFVIWNALWTPFADLIAVYEADVSRGQDTTLWNATSSVIADLFQFLKEFHSVLALETAVHEATLNRLCKFGQPDGSNTKLARTLRMIREPIQKAPWTTLLDQVKGDVIAAEKLDLIIEPRELSRVPNFEKQRRDSHAA
ncbi:hypothetical protein DFH94DRAFT_633058 [Russula ochroleuca]|uniref:Phorbol-ester/DAG-type domain-containing protein n=1 Tax=Russula ochroleuca TaxID=152965 RepID=A0A9P5MTU2_9AGAM|nr:hypothetical protein DFH94DRAFT_633058 [Russula ochroleuca]